MTDWLVDIILHIL